MSGLLGTLFDAAKAPFRRAKDLMGPMGTEIMILYRVPGRIKLAVPPLLYEGSAAYVLRSKIGKSVGIASVEVDEERATAVITYDPEATSEAQVLLLIHDHLNPLVKPDTGGEMADLTRRRRSARIKRTVFKGANVLVVGYLVKIHWRRLLGWVMSPLTYWAPLATVAFLVWAHRKVLARGLSVKPA